MRDNTRYGDVTKIDIFRPTYQFSGVENRKIVVVKLKV